jgi:hypothetical protein
MSAPTKKGERVDPAFITAHMQKCQTEIIDTLPPIYKLKDPDTSWDTIIPHLKAKRQALHACIHGGIEGMHRAFMGPLISEAQPIDYIATAHGATVFDHRKTLVNSCINALSSISELHKSMGGGSHRCFLLSYSIIEYTTVLGICLMSGSPKDKGMVDTKSFMTTAESDLRSRTLSSFQQGLKVLDLLSQRSPIAKRGIGILKKLNAKITTDDQATSSSGRSPASPRSIRQSSQDEPDVAAAAPPPASLSDVYLEPQPWYPEHSEKFERPFDAFALEEGWNPGVYDAAADENFSWILDGDFLNEQQDAGMNFEGLSWDL